MSIKQELLLYILENNGTVDLWDMFHYFQGTNNIEKYVLELRRERRIELKFISTGGKAYSYKYFVVGG